MRICTSIIFFVLAKIVYGEQYCRHVGIYDTIYKCIYIIYNILPPSYTTINYNILLTFIIILYTRVGTQYIEAKAMWVMWVRSAVYEILFGPYTNAQKHITSRDLPQIHNLYSYVYYLLYNSVLILLKFIIIVRSCMNKPRSVVVVTRGRHNDLSRNRVCQTQTDFSPLPWVIFLKKSHVFHATRVGTCCNNICCALKV